MSMLDRAQLISVTIDFLYELPEVGGRQIMENNEKLKAALYAVGFDTDKSITLMHDKNVRVPQDHTCYRKTTVITGTMRKDFVFKDIYLGCNILDVQHLSSSAESQFIKCDSLPCCMPEKVKVNTRKYTRCNDNQEETIAGEEDLV